MQETRVRTLAWQDHLERKITMHPSILAWEISWNGQRILAGYRSDMTEGLSRCERAFKVSLWPRDHENGFLLGPEESGATVSIKWGGRVVSPGLKPGVEPRSELLLFEFSSVVPWFYLQFSNSAPGAPQNGLRVWWVWERSRQNSWLLLPASKHALYSDIFTFQIPIET